MSNYLGCVYVFSNPSMPGLLKVGKADNSEERIKELSSSTGVPEPFEEVAVFPSDHPYRDEREAHEILSEYRNKSNREFFKLDPEKCIDILKTVLGDPIPSSDQPYINIFEAAKSGNSSAVISLINFANSKNIDVFDSLCLYDSKEKISCHETKESSKVESVRQPNFTYKGEKKDGTESSRTVDPKLKKLKEVEESLKTQRVEHGEDKFYLDGALRYKGEVKDGKFEGRGKEYFEDGTLWYEGEFKDGKRHGRGKTYDEDGTLWYEGEFKDGKQHGQGKKYNKDGILDYEGEWKEGKRHGRGRITLSDGTKYEGEWKDDKSNFQGKIFRDNGSLLYEGEVKDGELNGHGKYFHDDGTLWYEGEFKDGNRNGQGKYFYKEGDWYEGEFKDGHFHGQGKVYYKDGRLYFEGEFKDGKICGEAKEFLEETEDNLSFEEEWKNRGEFNKEFEQIRYHAELKDGQYNGMGKVFDNKILLYEGELRDGIFEGNGKAFFKSGIIGYEGQWKNGKWDGFGKLYNSFGDIVYEGKWEDGEKID